MATKSFSAINGGTTSTINPSTDQLLMVRSGTTDLLGSPLIPSAAIITHTDQTQTYYNGTTTSAADIGVAIQAAFTALQANETIEIGPVAATISTTGLTIPSGVNVILNGTRLTNGTANLVMFTATSSTWSLTGLGGATLIGIGGAGGGTETALSITPGTLNNSWSVSGLIIKGWNQYGILFTAGGDISDHKNGTVNDISSINVGGTHILIPASVEYMLFSDIEIAGGGGTGISCCGGNNQFVGGTITGVGTVGFDLVSGTNDSHGTVTGFLFNHNGAIAIRLGAIANGFQFVNCDLFGNTTGISIGAVASSIQFIGGILASPITFTGTPVAYISFQTMQLTSAATFATYTDQQRGWLKFYQCFTTTGLLTGYPVGNDALDPTMGGTGNNASLVANAIPYTLTSGVLGQDTGFTRDGSGTTTIKGPITISTTDPQGATGSMVVTAGDNTQIAAIDKGKADTVSPVVYPSTISPTLWIAADRIAASPLGKIASIPDLSGNGKNFTPTSVQATLIPNALNGLPVIRATGVANQFYDTASFSLSQPFTVICVFKKVTATNKVLFGGKTSGNAMLYSFAASSAKMNAGSDATVTCTPTNWNIGVFSYNGASSAYRINTGGSATTVNPGSNGIAGGFRLFEFNSGTGFAYDGDLAELILYPNANATTAQVEGIVQYLSNKWAITLGAQGTSGASTVQVGDLRQWQTPAGAILSAIDANGRLKNGGGATAPGIAAGVGAGTSPTVTITAGSSDQSGQISVLTGSSPTASAVVATITYANAWGATARPMLTPANAAAAALSGNAQIFVSSPGASSFAVSVGSTNLAATTTYLWNYFVMQ